MLNTVVHFFGEVPKSGVKKKENAVFNFKIDPLFQYLSPLLTKFGLNYEQLVSKSYPKLSGKHSAHTAMICI